MIRGIVLPTMVKIESSDSYFYTADFLKLGSPPSLVMALFSFRVRQCAQSV